jgi:hypothetical protein
MRFFCSTDRRRGEVRQHPGPLNGIDYLEVADRAAPLGQRQRLLWLHFVKPDPIAALDLATLAVHIEGGVRIRGIGVEGVGRWATDPTVIEVRVDQPGDYSTYTLRLEAVGDATIVLDPVLSSVDFTFKVECESDLDCRSGRTCACPLPTLPGPQIDYLAKDWESFRRLLLDRLSLIAPTWRERSPADLAVTLVELLAYVGDHLSYQQDAIATEAYLGTARRRISVRRHARLVDYSMHDGCNARAWVHVAANRIPLAPGEELPCLPKGTRLFTQVEGVPILPLGEDDRKRLVASAECFETMHALPLEPRLNALRFHTWGEDECVLPCGATGATLREELGAAAAGDVRPLHQTLRPGDVLVLEEVRGPTTGFAADANPAHRHAVRLEAVQPLVDPIGMVDEAGARSPLPVVNVSWGAADAVPFELCASARAPDGRFIDGVSLARGNIVLVDHGRSVGPERVGVAPAPAASGLDLGPARFRPRLSQQPLTHAAPPPRGLGRGANGGVPPPGTAAEAFPSSLDDLLPRALALLDDEGRTWSPCRDLVGSDAAALDFVAEVDDEGVAWLRFGDGRNGARPAAGSSLDARYRVGNGTHGNVGAEAIRHAVLDGPLAAHVAAVRNPLPARGGVDSETIEHVRSHAPAAFRMQERAATRDDYAEVALRHPEVQRAVATVRVAASWRTIFIAVDRVGGREVDDDFKEDLRSFLERYRMAGEDVDIAGPQLVSLDVALVATVQPEYFRSDVKRALLETLGSGVLPGGARGVFHPDNFTFAQPVLLSRVYAAAQAVPGVEHVRVTRFQRMGDEASSGLGSGQLEMGRLEIARLDSDPSFPERGVLRLDVEGGR